MAKYKDTCDLYDDNGKLLKSGHILRRRVPYHNRAKEVKIPR